MNAFPFNSSVQRYPKKSNALPLTHHSEGYFMFLNQDMIFDPSLLRIMAFPVTLQWGNFTGMTFLRKKHSLMRGFSDSLKRILLCV